MQCYIWIVHTVTVVCLLIEKLFKIIQKLKPNSHEINVLKDYGMTFTLKKAMKQTYNKDIVGVIKSAILEIINI